MVKPIKTSDLHIRAFLTHFEMACEFAILLAAGDLLWLFHDISTNGFNFTYGCIGILFTLGLVGTLIVLQKHHNKYTHRLMNKVINYRLKKEIV